MTINEMNLYNTMSYPRSVECYPIQIQQFRMMLLSLLTTWFSEVPDEPLMQQ